MRLISAPNLTNSLFYTDFLLYFPCLTYFSLFRTAAATSRPTVWSASVTWLAAWGRCVTPARVSASAGPASLVSTAASACPSTTASVRTRAVSVSTLQLLVRVCVRCLRGKRVDVELRVGWGGQGDTGCGDRGGLGVSAARLTMRQTLL